MERPPFTLDRIPALVDEALTYISWGTANSEWLACKIAATGEVDPDNELLLARRIYRALQERKQKEKSQ